MQEIVPGKTQLGPEIPWEVVGVVADEVVADGKAIHEINKDQTLTDLKNRLRSLLLTVFAAIAVLLAAIGIYSVISYSDGPADA